MSECGFRQPSNGLLGGGERLPRCAKRMMRINCPSVSVVIACYNRANSVGDTTVAYLESLGIRENVVRVWNPAFALRPEPYDGPETSFLFP